jgi:hypothetical protein
MGDSGIELITAVTPPELVNCPALGDRHQPTAGIVREAGSGHCIDAATRAS